METCLVLGLRATHRRVVMLRNVKLWGMSKHRSLDIHIPWPAAWGSNPPMGPCIVWQWPELAQGQDQYLLVHTGSHL